MREAETSNTFTALAATGLHSPATIPGAQPGACRMDLPGRCGECLKDWRWIGDGERRMDWVGTEGLQEEEGS